MCIYAHDIYLTAAQSSVWISYRCKWLFALLPPRLGCRMKGIREPGDTMLYPPYRYIYRYCWVNVHIYTISIRFFRPFFLFLYICTYCTHIVNVIQFWNCQQASKMFCQQVAYQYVGRNDSGTCYESNIRVECCRWYMYMYHCAYIIGRPKSFPLACREHHQYRYAYTGSAGTSTVLVAA